MTKEIELLTTGYAGHDPESFVTKLRKHGVERIVDVRQNPVSRKKGFSKSRLTEFLAQHGIEYVHLHALGVPRDLRDRLRGGDSTLEEYFAEFERYLTGQNAAIAGLRELALDKRSCLLCVEERPEDCHRSIVAKVLVADAPDKFRIKHI